jgi:hypothetical protein
MQLALLQPLDLEQIRAGRDLQRFDGGVEVAVLLLQARKLRAELAFFLLGHRGTVVGGARRGRRNLNKYRALSHKHQAMPGCRLLNGERGFSVPHNETGVDLVHRFWHTVTVSESDQGDLPYVHPIASCGTGTEASGA